MIQKVKRQVPWLFWFSATVTGKVISRQWGRALTMNGNDFLTPLAQTLRTRTRSPCTNTEQESTQISRYSTAELHSKDKGGSQTFQLSSCLQQPWNNTDRQMGQQGDGLPSAEGEQPPPATNNWGTCSLTHHICKSHIPRNKDEILLLVSASKFWEGHREVIAFVCACELTN